MRRGSEREGLVVAIEDDFGLEESPGHTLHDGDEELLVGKDLDQGGVGEVRQIDGAAVANGSDDLRGSGDGGEPGEDLAGMQVGGCWR